MLFPSLGLEVWGRPHRDYGDMIPFERLRPRSTRWQVAVGHGHYVPVPDRTIRLRPSWLIGDDELAATGSDYIALGHWNRAVKVGNVAAYYSGSSLPRSSSWLIQQESHRRAPTKRPGRSRGAACDYSLLLWIAVIGRAVRLGPWSRAAEP